MSKLIFLGSGNAFGHDGRRHSSYLIEFEDKGKHRLMMMDCGPSTLPALHKKGYSLGDLDLIYISHLHPDHMLGLALLVLDNKWISKLSNPIKLICPVGTQKFLRTICETIYSQDEAEVLPETYEFIETEPGSEYNLFSLHFQFLRAEHTANARMVAIKGAFSLGYSGDTSLVLESLNVLLTCKIVIHEASTFDLVIPNHTTIKDLLEVGINRPNSFFVSHVDSSVSSNTLSFQKNFQLAEDDMEIKF